jgi:Spy/CpxP family protein refolding chaperone
MKNIVLAMLLVLPAVAQAQGPPGGRMGQGRGDPRHEMLQGQIVQRFMNHVSNELNLDQSTRTKLQEHMKQSGEGRRALAERGTDLRLKLMVATRDSATTDAEFRKLLSEMNGLRQREEELFTKDQEELSRILTPRQQARFVFMWLRFQDQIREMAIRPQGPPPGGRR